ncbi:MAG: hypothetical protein NC419_03895 [Muribaculaceae bacterium]|nr:hypothetical protein [Muribaculaceae bacterium]
MRIGGLGNVFPTYVYNPNTVSAGSMNKLSRISDNVLDKKTDYSKAAEAENQNPLKKGETIDFAGIFAKQMQQGQNRAAKLFTKQMTPVEEETAQTAAKKPEQETENKITPITQNANADGADAESGNGNPISMQMQRAIQAYEMFMTA